MLLGVITATGGGLTRDLLSGEVPNVLRPGRLNMTAALVGVALYALLFEAGVAHYVSLWIVVALVMVLRLAAQVFDWTTPEASEVPARVTQVGGSVISPLRRIPAGRFRPRRQQTPTIEVASDPNDPGQEAPAEPDATQGVPDGEGKRYPDPHGRA
ncbi:MAG TPA: TRIC cation channel family protein, partial [Dehalococcoidia bacterium]|nr:TRIC cation channel family protein [Dehalococcoidia bacterium]